MIPMGWVLPGNSTVYQNLVTYHSIVKSINDDNYYCVIFCYFSQASDRVWHKGLIINLKHIEYQGQFLNDLLTT